MSAHTPGPWSVEDRVERLIVWADGFHDELASLNTVVDGDVEEGVQAVVEDEQRANARLIAAAPELLDLLKEHLAWYAGKILGPEDERRLIAKTKTAIAKAEGRHE